MAYVTAPFTGAQVATDLIGTVNYQKMKVTFGIDGVATDVSASNPFPVSVIGGNGLTDAQLRASPVPISATALTTIAANTGATVPSAAAFAVTPSNTVNFTNPTRGLYVGGTGDVVAIVGGSPVTFVAVPAGTVLPIVATRVNSTSTTATSIVGLV